MRWADTSNSRHPIRAARGPVGVSAACGAGGRGPEITDSLSWDFLHHRFSATTWPRWETGWMGEWRRSRRNVTRRSRFHESHEQLLYLLSEALVAPRGTLRCAVRAHCALPSTGRQAKRRAFCTFPSDDLMAIWGATLSIPSGCDSPCLWSCSTAVRTERTLCLHLPAVVGAISDTRNLRTRTGYGVDELVSDWTTSMTTWFRKGRCDFRAEIVRSAGSWVRMHCWCLRRPACLPTHGACSRQ